MATATTYTKTGTKAATAAKLDKQVFEVEAKNHELLKLAYETYLANGRDNLAVVKTRGLVRGGGKKPWRQKGTGRARFGSSRNPIWRGGGIVFGPTGTENYTKKLHLSAKRLAIRQALSLAAAENRLIVLEDLDGKSGKTADIAKLLEKVGAKRNILLVVEQKTELLNRATGNLAGVKLIQPKYINVYDAMNADCIVMTSSALQTVTEWLKPAKAATAKKGDA